MGGLLSTFFSIHDGDNPSNMDAAYISIVHFISAEKEESYAMAGPTHQPLLVGLMGCSVTLHNTRLCSACWKMAQLLLTNCH